MNLDISNRIEIDGNEWGQAGAELCQAQAQLSGTIRLLSFS